MKSICIAVWSVCFLALADGPIGPPVDDRLLRDVRNRDAAHRANVAKWARMDEEAALKRSMMANEWRQIDGVKINLLNPRFIKFSGRVISSSAQGVIISAAYDAPTTYVKNYPYAVADRSWVEGYAVESGVYRYTTVAGAAATARQVDFGTPTTPPQRTAQEIAAEQVRIDLARRDAEDRQQAMAIRVLAHQHQQASNGYPSFQIELARRYMRGDGVETNLALARHWLQSACTNGEPAASNLLSQIRQ